MPLTFKSYEWLDTLRSFPVPEVKFSDFKYPEGATVLQLRTLVVKSCRKSS